ncbi:hypothetical protein M3598_14335 [Cytobacillus oceanisediminis]|nr:hypothetical protein [Cytobacillus oceanisediminis]
MKPSWRPFPGFPSVFRLHEAVMPTFSGFTNRSWRHFWLRFHFYEPLMTKFLISPSVFLFPRNKKPPQTKKLPGTCQGREIV